MVVGWLWGACLVGHDKTTAYIEGIVVSASHFRDVSSSSLCDAYCAHHDFAAISIRTVVDPAKYIRASRCWCFLSSNRCAGCFRSSKSFSVLFVVSK